MNLVESLMKSFGGDVLGNLSGALGAGEQDVQKAVSAALPALLSGIGSLAEKPRGAEKLWSAVQDTDENIVGNFAKMLSGGQQDELVNKGTGLLENLLGSSTLGSLISVLASFLGGKKALVTKLLPMLAPMILGSLKKQVVSNGLDLGGLTKMLLGQKDNISRAMPQGLMKSLANTQGLGDLSGFAQSASAGVTAASRAASSTARATRDAAVQSASPMRWLLPLLLLAIAACGVYWMMNRAGRDATAVQETIENTVDQVGTVTRDFDDYFANMGTALTGITDVDSAQAALPKLEGMATQLDTLGKAFQSLPSASRPALAQTVATAVQELESQRQRIEEIPGVGGILKSILDTIFEKLAAIIKG